MTESRAETNMTRDHVFDALVQRLIEFGEDKAAVAERARVMIKGWSWFSDNSMDERGHLTCYDWMDSRIAWLLDQDERLRYGLVPEDEATLRSEMIRYGYELPE
jgi:hypothetical protein